MSSVRIVKHLVIGKASSAPATLEKERAYIPHLVGISGIFKRISPLYMLMAFIPVHYAITAEAIRKSDPALYL